jgi:hypothetical protein
VLRARTLPTGVTLTGVWTENMRPQAAMRLEFLPYATFAYSIEMSLGSARYSVSASPIGIVRVAPREADGAPG